MSERPGTLGVQPITTRDPIARLVPVNPEMSAPVYPSAMQRLVFRSDGGEAPRLTVGRGVRTMRAGAGLSQRQLAARVGCSQAFVSTVESGSRRSLTIEQATRFAKALGGRLEVVMVGPLVIAERQRDPAHARCAGSVETRLRRAGWQTAAEVEIDGGTTRGWIDLLAWHPASRIVLVIEIKTEIHDLGEIQRTLGWYEREAWAAARRLGWRPGAVRTALIVLHTAQVDQRIADASEAIRVGFPAGATRLQSMIDAGSAMDGRAIALVDPRSRRAHWLRPTRLDGRRTPAPYRDYADFMAAGRREITRRNVRRSDHAWPPAERDDDRPVERVGERGQRRHDRQG